MSQKIVIKNVFLNSTDLGTPVDTFIVSKNPQFLSNDYETWSILTTNEYLILIEFHNRWVKIVDFLIKAYVL